MTLLEEAVYYISITRCNITFLSHWQRKIIHRKIWLELTKPIKILALPPQNIYNIFAKLLFHCFSMHFIIVAIFCVFHTGVDPCVCFGKSSGAVHIIGNILV